MAKKGNKRNLQQQRRAVKMQFSAQKTPVGSFGASFEKRHPSEVSRVPLASSKKKSARQPRVNGSKAFTVNHSEFVADLTSVDPGFEVVSYPINPAQSVTFPWLASLSKNFDQYRIKSMIVRFESAAPATENGRVFLAFDYDPQDDPPATKGEFMSFRGATSDAVWTSSQVIFSGPRLGKVFYTRPGQVLGDVRLFDAANLIVSTSGVSNGLLCGELYIDYTIELINPQGAVACAAEAYAAALMSSAVPAQITTLLLNCQSSNPSFCTIDSNTDFTIKTPGNYIVSIWILVTAGAPSTATPLTLAVTSGAASVGGIGYGYNSSPNSIVQQFLIDQNDVAATYRFAGGASSISGNNQIYVTPAPG